MFYTMRTALTCVLALLLTPLILPPTGTSHALSNDLPLCETPDEQLQPSVEFCTTVAQATVVEPQPVVEPKLPIYYQTKVAPGPWSGPTAMCATSTGQDGRLFKDIFGYV